MERYLVPHLYTADPHAHVFNGKLYIYPSHDIDAGIPENDNGDHFRIQLVMDGGANGWDYGGVGGTTADYIKIDSVSLAVVPEPATIGLVGLGGLVSLLVRRRKLS